MKGTWAYFLHLINLLVPPVSSISTVYTGRLFTRFDSIMSDQITPPCNEVHHPSDNSENKTEGADGPRIRHFPCLECARHYTRKESLNRHIRNIHHRIGISVRQTNPILRGYDHQCAKCNNCYLYKRGLIRHDRDNHQQNAVRYQCKLCPSFFNMRCIIHKYELMQKSAVHQSQPLHYNVPSERLWMWECLKEMTEMFKMWKSKQPIN